MYRYLTSKHYRLVVLFFLLIAINSYSQENLLLKEFIGKHPIVISIIYDPSSQIPCSAEYYYQSQKKTILLKGSFFNNSFNLWGPLTRWGNDSTETFLIKSSSNNNWSGNWKGNKKTLPVNLTPIDINFISHQFSKLTNVKNLKNDNPYQYVLTSEISFKITDTVCYENNTCFHVLKEELSNIDFF